MGALVTGLRNGMPEFRPYAYRGTGEDTLTPPELQAQLDAVPETGIPEGLVHVGSPREYRAHYRRGEKPCKACRDANALRCAELLAERERFEQLLERAS